MLTMTTARMAQAALGSSVGRVQMCHTVRVAARGGKDQVIHREDVAEAANAVVPEADRGTMDVSTNISWEEERVWRVDLQAQVEGQHTRS